MSYGEAEELISLSVLVSCTRRRLGGGCGGERYREERETYPFLLGYGQRGGDNLNAKIFKARR